jgi:hypothetical protein
MKTTLKLHLSHRFFILAFVLILGNTLSLQAQLSGEYIIGTGGDYTTISAAVNDLNQNGISASTTFKIKDGVYNERVQIGQIVGVSATDTVVITSESGVPENVTISLDASNQTDNYLIYLNQTERVTISNITFLTASNNFCSELVLASGASHNRVQNCNFLASNEVSNTGHDYALVKTVQDGFFENNNSFKNNRFDGGSYGVFMGAEPGNVCLNNEFISNKFENQGINAALITSQKNFAFNHNHVTAISSFDNAVKSTVNSGRHEYIGNHVQYTGTASGFIIHSHDFITPDDTVFFINNKVFSSSSDALRVTQSKEVFIAHNTLYTEASTAFAISFSDVNNVLSQNNLFINNADGYPLSSSSVTGNLVCNHNGYYSVNGKIGTTDAGTFEDLSTWQASTLGSNSPGANSASGFLPVFRNEPIDFTPACGMPVQYQTNNFLPQFAIDFNGKHRSPGLVWMGAAELRLPESWTTDITGYITNETDTLKAGFVELYADTSDLTMLDLIGTTNISNNGSYNLNSVQFEYNYWIKIFPDNQAFPNYVNCYHHGNLRWSEGLPLEMTDSCSSLDTNLVPRLIEPIVSGDYSISGYVGKRSFVNRRAGTEPIPGLDIILDKTPPSKTVAIHTTDANGLYTFDNLPSGRYTVIIDYEGLGADTLYQIDLNESNDSVFNADYCVDTTRIIEGCYPETNSIAEHKLLRNTNIYPNPFNDILTIETDLSNYAYEIFTTDGKIIAQEQQVSFTRNIRLNDIPSGMYFIRITSEDSSKTVPIIK